MMYLIHWRSNLYFLVFFPLTLLSDIKAESWFILLTLNWFQLMIFHVKRVQEQAENWKDHQRAKRITSGSMHSHKIAYFVTSTTLKTFARYFQSTLFMCYEQSSTNNPVREYQHLNQIYFIMLAIYLNNVWPIFCLNYPVKS